MQDSSEYLVVIVGLRVGILTNSCGGPGVNESGSLLATAGPALAAFPDLTGAYGL